MESWYLWCILLSLVDVTEIGTKVKPGDVVTVIGVQPFRLKG